MNSNIKLFLESCRKSSNLSDEKLILLKKTLLLDINFEQYIDIYLKFNILDTITSELILQKSNIEQVKSILSLSLPIKESTFPIIVFGVLKNYKNLVKELYNFLTKISDSALKLIVNDVLFEDKYFIYLCKIMKNNLRFVEIVIQSKKYDVDNLIIFAESKEPEVIFRVANIKHIVEKSDELIKKILFNPYSPDESVTLMKQILIEKNVLKESKKTEEDLKEENDNTKEVDEIKEEKVENKSLVTAVESKIDKKINESLYNKINKMNMAEKIKLALKGNKTARMLLINDPNKQVSVNVLKNPKITEQEIEFVLKNKSTGEHIIREIARTNTFIRNYNIMKDLIFHPKTPINISMNLINRLIAPDLEKLSKSRDVPVNLKNQALRLFNVKNNRK